MDPPASNEQEDEDMLVPQSDVVEGPQRAEETSIIAALGTRSNRHYSRKPASGGSSTSWYHVHLED
ncbi:hypothetical protein CASFOL_035143 [Castilleja foliolosa]|uniref:Uncharacterized protein n=1 Tax=Castilleja foliolosa TaxID=1961234 RepID=A0ABD3BTD9_9LAMI